ncbi:MAG: 30S ribosome-binding factor RbfA [Verrucomicrobiae bacterium]|nr:30S ribosome-binding factor RbfA [Verrucomicrobiae bacterium]
MEVVMTTPYRLERVRELIKREVGEAIQRCFPIEQAGMISVYDVEVSKDFQMARVYVSILGNEEKKKKGFEFLQENRNLIQQHVAKAVVLKHTPKIQFVLDNSIERGNRVLSIIEELEKNNPSSS